MHTILKLVSLGLIGTVFLVIIREERGDIGVILRLAIGVALLLLLVSPLAQVLSGILQLVDQVKIRGLYLGLLLRVIGIAYVATFAAHIANDSGEAGIGWRIEVGAKIVILALALPLISAILHTVLKMIPS
ncbi:stage III sporulation AC/AD family protein [Sulfobacillus thermosulfidooxidans]|uniref:Stage III sporulation protein AD n=2 Tax=Sulfobacillus thermosulfidooxidans TaxID=28034 RepID=A0A1W1WIT2_SULTA|nr:stage III sporulation AC/AD family protein [Sulfobacillus thermosulfidooxidans]OLZ08546.1 stage III sporulation protein AD [Sulfobacillus thermosulfidooxidans]OLZ13148.1 stage III sporulation protein AD [Sulfobacillus thermosulfidooxidans]OLZ21528.1 stage III sporulation protein AD [Sulfobacillus thermosulfidooxidans]PSR29223.1 MAG: stage III sporulation protein AD [Sulfobacillus thermosulfidooxidans]SMC06166.1 stage III sporulation protein AD [Sulfobacillus thermosulfidooxidans DSM 9293]